MSLTSTQIRCLRELAESGAVKPTDGRLPEHSRNALLALEKRGLISVIRRVGIPVVVVIEFGITKAGRRLLELVERRQGP